MDRGHCGGHRSPRSKYEESIKKFPTIMRDVMQEISVYLAGVVKQDCSDFLDQGIKLLKVHAQSVDIVPFVTTLVSIATMHQSLLQSWRLNTSKIPLELMMAPVFNSARRAIAQIDCMAFYAGKIVDIKEKLIRDFRAPRVDPTLESDARDSERDGSTPLRKHREVVKDQKQMLPD